MTIRGIKNGRTYMVRIVVLEPDTSIMESEQLKPDRKSGYKDCGSGGVKILRDKRLMARGEYKKGLRKPMLS